MTGGGGDGTRAALPMPEGSLTEPLSPRALAGPGGMPLTPASCAGNLAGAARTPTTASAAIHRREKTSCARFMARYPLADLSAHGQEPARAGRSSKGICKKGRGGCRILSIEPPCFGQTAVKAGAGFRCLEA
jgi:hypothetical protein